MHNLLDLPPRQIFVSDVRRVSLQTRMFAGHDVGDVMSNLFKSDAADDANFESLSKDIATMTLPTKKSPRKCDKFIKMKFKILACVVLPGRLGPVYTEVGDPRYVR